MADQASVQPILVRWLPAEAQLMDHLANITRTPIGTKADPPELSGRIEKISTAEMILPVLDGFDEIGGAVHEKVVETLGGLHEMLLVMTSRPEEYVTAVQHRPAQTINLHPWHRDRAFPGPPDRIYYHRSMPITIDQLAGYVDRDLDADLARWFPDEARVSIPASTRPVEPFLARLPEDAASALASFDRKVRSGNMAQFLGISDWSYAFEFAANDCEIVDSDYETTLSDDDVWSIGADGSGNYYVVLASGRVAVWFHEEQVIEPGTQFDNLDVFLWSVVRYQAVRSGVLDRAAVEDDFRSLGQDGALAPEIGLLADLR